VDEYRELVDGIGATNRTGEKERRLRSARVSAENNDPERDDETVSALTSGVSAEARDSRSAESEASALTLTERRNGFLRSPMGELQPPSKNSPPTGGAPPPDPRRRPPPPASAFEAQRSPTDPPAPAQDQQRNSLPRDRAANVVDFFTREAM
jgi:hypothetical protein